MASLNRLLKRNQPIIDRVLTSPEHGVYVEWRGKQKPTDAQVRGHVLRLVRGLIALSGGEA